MRPFARADRVGGQIQKAMSDLLHKKLKDPRLENVTITGVKLTRDLRLAKIYFALSDPGKKGGDKSQRDAALGFKSATGFIKRSLAQQLGLKYMPDLKFYHDPSFDYGSKIETLLKTLKTDHASNHK